MKSNSIRALVAVVLPLAFILSLPACKKNDLEPDLGTDEQLDDAAPPEGDGPGAKRDASAGRDVPLVPPKDSTAGKKDGGGIPSTDFTAPVPAFPNPPDPSTVAAVQYGAGQAALVKPACGALPDPERDVCALKELIIQARGKNASLVVTPEYASGQKYLEPVPAIGENPGQSTSWPNVSAIKTYSYLAKQLGIYLVINVQTYKGTGTSQKKYNTNIAFGPDGAVLDVHFKFNLYGGESKELTPGTDVSVFNTPLGTTGQLVCADIYGDDALLSKLAGTLKARVVIVSSEWVSPDPITWYFIPYAKTWGVYLIVSNWSDPTLGYGGVIVRPDGTVISQVKQTSPSVLIGTIPAP